MTRNEYLETLNQSLSFLDAETRSATISFYAELLCDRMEDGMTEEEAVSAMESAEVIASRMLKEYGVNSAPPSDAQETRPISPCTITYTQSDLSSLEAVFMDRAVVIEPSPTSALTITYLEDELLKQTLEQLELEAQISALEKEVDAAKSDSYVIQIARSRYGYLMPGEVRFEVTNIDSVLENPEVEIVEVGK